jgi:uncharacterized BrkB/YihY/UPF0761 family membrane protein
VSIASCVRETRELTGDDAWRTLATTGHLRLIRDAFSRLRRADGFSHVRSLAFALSLVMVQGLITLVGLAVELGQTSFSHTILGGIDTAVPGPASSLLTWAFAQAKRVGLAHGSLPLLLGLGGTLVTATTATGQIIRGINRIYGVEYDGPTVQKYARAFLLALLVLGAFVAGVAVLTWGRGLDVGRGHGRHVAWSLLRWPVALALAAMSVGAILRWAPRRRQPRWSWLVFGGVVGVAGWTLVTLALAVVFRLSSSFGEVYGALAGVVALQMWSFLSSAAIFFGVSVAAQLEAVRSGTTPSQRPDP